MLRTLRHLTRRKYVSQTLSASLTRRLSTNPFDHLTDRGFIAQLTSKNLAVALEKPQTVYLGVDPSASSLHVGNLLALLALLHFKIRGHNAIALIGGATGSIGDPGGRSTERKLLSEEELDFNVDKVTKQVHNFFAHGEKYARARLPSLPPTQSPMILNNMQWLSDFGLLDFLRSIGKHAKVNTMIARDSVKSRLESESGISFTEFTYQLLQAYDFYTLFTSRGCRIQLGGSDQWGNIVAGIDLIKRLQPAEEAETAEEVFGMTIPLLTTSSGAKFGKSAGNAVWLDASLTSVFDFYQFFLRISDADVRKYLNLFTLLDRSQIDTVMRQHEENPDQRPGQHALASEVTELVHGELGLRQARAATSVLFETAVASIRSEDVINALSSDPRLKLVSEGNSFIGEQVTKLAATYKLTRSRSEARQLLSSGGLYVNNQRLFEDRRIEELDLIDSRMVVLRLGKDNHVILALPEHA